MVHPSGGVWNSSGAAVTATSSSRCSMSVVTTILAESWLAPVTSADGCRARGRTGRMRPMNANGVPGGGLAKGLAVTLRTMTRRSHTQQYPDVAPELPPRSRGVIALLEENCTVCMLCARECPDWCIYIDSHKEEVAVPGAARPRQRNVLDRFDIDFSLCMYCGICIEAARSTRSTGRRSSSTPSTTSGTCCTTRTTSGSGWRPCRRRPRTTRTASRRRRRPPPRARPRRRPARRGTPPTPARPARRPPEPEDARPASR